MSLLDLYHEKIARGEIGADPAQARAAQHLHRLGLALDEWRPGKKAGALAFLGMGKKVTPPEGVYLWGGVGRGKSMLMDLFFAAAPVTHKRRVHFHAFMQETHERIFNWRQKEKSGEVKGGDPLPPVAREIAREATLLCFDEFQVHDIADASILGRLFTALFDLGTVVVATSNRAPDGLYEGGLNRHRLVPFIDLVKSRMDVVHLDSSTDYRLDRLLGLPVYYAPLGSVSRMAMDSAFQDLTDGVPAHDMTLALKGRALYVPQAAHGVARFSFADLCAKPLGAADYLKIAQSFHTLFVDDVPRMSAERRNEAKRFVTLIDALYEAKVRLFLSADAAPELLYEKGDGAFEFERTVSRLMEMQSADYLKTCKD